LGLRSSRGFALENCRQLLAIQNRLKNYSQRRRKNGVNFVKDNKRKIPAEGWKTLAESNGEKIDSTPPRIQPRPLWILQRLCILLDVQVSCCIYLLFTRLFNRQELKDNCIARVIKIYASTFFICMNSGQKKGAGV